MRKVYFKTICLSFILILISSTVYAAEGIYIQPYLQNITKNRIDILWWTDKDYQPATVKYGKDICNNTVNADVKYEKTVGKYLNKATLTDLEKGEKYKYYVKSGDYLSKKYLFKTAPEIEEEMSFVVLGDGRTDNPSVIKHHREVTELAMKQTPDLAFQLGDIVYSGDQKEWAKFWRQVATDSDKDFPGVQFASHIPYYLAIGNHEIWTAEATDGVEGDLRKGYGNGNLSTTMARYKAYVSNPPNDSKNPDWDGRYYSFKYGPATFIVLDSNSIETNGYLATDAAAPGWLPGTEQYDWMINELDKAQKESVFTFVMMHHSPYTRGGHGKPTEVQTGYPIRSLDKIFHKYGVDSVISSHDHLVGRSVTGPKEIITNEELLKGKEGTPEVLNYFVVGNSGHSAREAKPGWEEWMSINIDGKAPFYSQYYYDWAEKPAKYFSFLNVSITKEDDNNWQAVIEVIRTDEKRFDKIVLNRKDVKI